MTRQQRVLLFLAALALLGGLATVAVMMFFEPAPPSIGSVPAGGPEPKPAADAPSVESRGSGHAPAIAPSDAAAIKPRSFAEPDAMAVSGFVRDERDVPVEGALCELFEDVSPLRDTIQEGELHGRQRTEANGAFWFDRNTVPPADHFMIKVRHASYATARKPVDVRVLAAGGVVIVLKSGTRVSGRVGAAASGAPIPGATVTVFDGNQGAIDPEGSVEAQAIADATGAWTVGHVTPGSKRIVASAPGYATAGAPAVAVVAGVALEHVDFSLRAAGGISGRVTTTDGAPLEGLYVTVRPVRIKPFPDAGRQTGGGEADPRAQPDGEKREGDPDGERERARGKPRTPEKPLPSNVEITLTLSGRTGADGRYSIPGADAGTYVVTAIAPGFLPAGAISVESPAQEVNFVLKPGARILGQVVDAETGQPVPRFRIGIASSADQAVIAPYTKRAFGPPKFQDGRFELREFAAGGTVWLVAEAPGYAGGRSEAIVVVPGERREGIVIRVVRGATVKGRVVDAAGQPIPGASLVFESGVPSTGQGADVFGKLFMRNMKPEADVRTGNDGRFAIPRVLPGNYALTVRHEEFGPRTTQPFVVGSGETVLPDVVLSRGATVRGRVRLKDGAADAEATVQVGLAAGGTASLESIRTARTDADGRYEVAGLAPGQYRVSVIQRAGKPDLSAVFKPSGEVITLGEGESREVDL